MKIFPLQKVSQVKSRNDYIFWHARNLRIVLLKKFYFVWEINEWIYKWHWNRKCSVTNPLSRHNAVSNETLSFLNLILNIIADKNVTIIHGLQKNSFNFTWGICQEQAFPYHLSKGKFGNNASWDISISPAQSLVKGD